MATPSEKMAESLEVLRDMQERGIVAVRSAELDRPHRERLVKNGFLTEIIKGWYVPTRPGEQPGSSTVWYTAYWPFCAAYLAHRFGKDWCLSPEQSLLLHAGSRTVPTQLLVRAPKGRNNVTAFPHETSLLEVRAKMPDAADIEEIDGLRVYTPPSALISCKEAAFTQSPTDMRAALSLIRDASEVLEPLLEGGHSTIAGRLAGAFRNIGRVRIADEVVKAMRAAGYTVREADPFERKAPLIFSARVRSPYVNRIRLMWHAMRESVVDNFPAAPGLPEDQQTYLKTVDDIYVTDAYHSLSIEGYRVNVELIERVRSGNWDPEGDDKDRDHRNALAARGYWQAYQEVRNSVEKVLGGDNPGLRADQDHSTWYREMFAPSVTAGILRVADLAGYRNGPVFIRNSMHVPPNRDAVRELMPAFFELLEEEANPAVRVVLGHFIFVYIHPYVDGNGRIGRFLMNVMNAAGGYPWTVVPVEKRNEYMAALEQGSVHQNIVPFTRFLGGLHGPA